MTPPRTMRFGLLSLTLLLAFAAHARRARADTPVAVLGLEALDGAPAALVSSVAQALKDQVSRTPGHRLAPGKSLDEVRLLFGCADDSAGCIARAGKSFGARKLIWGSLQKTPSGFVLQIRLLDVPTATLERQLRRQVTRAALQQSVRLMTRLVPQLLVAAGGTIVVTSNVGDAQVLLGTRPAGQTVKGGALTLRDVAAGVYLVRVVRDGYRAFSRKVTVEGGQSLALHATLDIDTTQVGTPPATQPLVDRPTGSGRLGWKIAFWTALAATVGAGVAMIPTGLAVRAAEDDKTRFLEGLPPGLARSQGCDFAALDPQLASICNRGDSRATTFNVLLGVTIGSAALGTFFGIMAYRPGDDAEGQKRDSGDKESRRPARVTRAVPHVLPVIGPGHAEIGLRWRF